MPQVRIVDMKRELRAGNCTAISAELRRELAGKLSAFTGNSGVGKSSILNALDPRFSLAVGEVSKAWAGDGTPPRHVELFSLGQDTYVIDTPALRPLIPRSWTWS